MSISIKPTGLTYNGKAQLSRAGKHIANVSCKLSEFEEHVTIHEAGTRSPRTGSLGARRWCGEVISPVDLELEGIPFILHFLEGNLPEAHVVLTNRKEEKDGTWIFSLPC